jgi:hypothetical protein
MSYKKVLRIVQLFAVIACFLPGTALEASWTYGRLCVVFQPGAIDSLWRDSTGFIRCGIPYIDSINQANNCQDFYFAGDSALPSTNDDYMVIFLDSAGLPAIADAYEVNANVVDAWPDYRVMYDFTPDDSLLYRGYDASTLHCRQWALDSAHCQFEKAWDITRGDSNVVIAIIDIGFRYTQPDLAPKQWINTSEDKNGNGTYEPWKNDSTIPGDWNDVDDDGNGFVDDVIGFDFVPGRGRKIDTCGIVVGACEGGIVHGTIVASIAAAATNNQIGVAGAAPNCKIMFLRGESNFERAKAVAYARKMGADVINMSWSADIFADSIAALAREMSLSATSGIVMTVSGGNLGTDTAAFPARSLLVLSVTAVDTNDVFPSSYTIAGFDPSYHTSVDLAAPVQHWTAYRPLRYVSPPTVHWNYLGAADPARSCPGENLDPIGTGNSFSAPLVAGAAALVKSAYPDLTSAEIRAKIKSSTDPIRFEPGDSARLVNKVGTGRLNAFKAATYFGNIPNDTTTDTSLDGTIYVSGDITVKSGKTLRLKPGTLLRFYPGDVMQQGVDVGKEEIVVDSGGRLVIEGTAANPVKLVSFRKEPDSIATDDWYGIRVKRGGSVVCSNLVLRHAYAGITFEGTSVACTLKNVHIARSKVYGIKIDSSSNVVVRNCAVDSVFGPGYGIQVVSNDTTGPKLIKDTVRACTYGIYVLKGANSIDSCVIQGDAGGKSNTGVYVLWQSFVDTNKNYSVKATSINGYFTNEHFHNFEAGRSSISGCEMVSPTSPRSPTAVRNTAGSYLKLRGSTVAEWGSTGVLVGHNGGQISDLGSVANPADSGYNTIFTTGTVPGWKYIKDLDYCPGCSNPTIQAEWNCYNTEFPVSGRFSPNVDFNPYDITCGLFKIAAGGDGSSDLTRIKPTALFQNYPNPFNPATLIQFNLERPERVNLEIFNILGQKVRTLLSGEVFAAGPYTFLWDGKDDRGSAVSSGLYVYRLKTPTYLQTKKMMLVK